MKKLYFGAAFMLLAAGTTIAQTVERPYTFDNKIIENVAQSPSEQPIPKALGVTFWTDNFSTGTNWTIDNDGQASPFGWNIGSTVNSWWGAFSAGINSTSGGGFAEVNNGDYNTNNQAIGVTYTMTSAAPINVTTLAGTSQVSLSFEQFGALFNDGQRVLVSTNGTTFTEVYTNNNRTVYVGNNPAALYANPETVTVNLANAIAGNPSTVWIQFEWTSRFPSNTAPVAWTTFGWFIDDVALTTNPDNNITVSTPFWGTLGLNYYQIPLTQAAPIEFTTNVVNNGINTQTDVMLNVDINSGAYTGASPAGVDIVGGGTDSLVVANPFTPTALGNYAVTWDVSQNEVDDVPTDNVNAPFDFDVTQFTYARDAGTITGAFNNGGNQFILGSYYDIFANQNIYSVDVMVAATSVAGATINARIYSLDPNGTSLATALILEDQSADYILTTGDLGQMINLDLLFGGLSGFPMVAGETYFLAVASDGDGGLTNDFNVGTAGTAPDQTCFLYDGPDDTWYYTTSTPMIRMNLDPASTNVGVGENSQVFGVSVYPNPTSEQLSVRYTLGNTADVTISVVDITGKEIANFNEGSKNEGSHVLNMNTASFANGIYYVTIATDDSFVTEKIVKK